MWGWWWHVWDVVMVEWVCGDGVSGCVVMV